MSENLGTVLLGELPETPEPDSDLVEIVCHRAEDEDAFFALGRRWGFGDMDLAHGWTLRAWHPRPVEGVEPPPVHHRELYDESGELIASSEARGLHIRR
jgi:hypothetical protein